MVLRSRMLQTSLVAVSALVASVNAFPTAENFAKLVQPGLAVADDFPDVHRELLRLRQKRLLVDLSSDPIDGMCYYFGASTLSSSLRNIMLTAIQ